MTPTETVVRARGHANVAAAHASTLEVTSEDFLTPAGDCIIGVEADRVPREFSDAFCEASRSDDARITLTLEAHEEATGRTHTETISGRGHPGLTFESNRSVVVRTSEYVDDRTVMVSADEAAEDLDRDLIEALAEGCDLRATLRVE